MNDSWSPPRIGDRVIGSNIRNFESGCRSSGPYRQSHGFDRFSRKRACWSSARGLVGESGARSSAIASPVRLNLSRAVNWSSSAGRMEIELPFRIAFIHSVPQSRCPRFGSRAPRQAERQLPSESCCKRGEVSLPCDTQVLNCTRVCTSDRKGKTRLDFWWSRAATFGYAGYDLFGAERHFAVLKRRAREPNLVRSVSRLPSKSRRRAAGPAPQRLFFHCLLLGLQYWRWRVVRRPGIEG